MKRLFVYANILLTSLIFNLIFCLNPLYAHKQCDNFPVHQWLANEAFYLWPNDINHEIYQYIGSIDERYDNQEALIGSTIIKGTHDEDEYDPLSNVAYNHFEGKLSNFNSHFWDNNQYDISISGLPILEWKFWSAVKKAEFYWYGGKDYYPNIELTENASCKICIPFYDQYIEYKSSEVSFSGLINLYIRGEKDKAYYYLGRLIHLLSDMGVPAHVHNDPHPLHDSYESFIATDKNYQMFTHANSYGGETDYEQCPDNSPWKENWNDKSKLFKIFYWLSEKADDFESNDEDGEDEYHKKGHSVPINNIMEYQSVFHPFECSSKEIYAYYPTTYAEAYNHGKILMPFTIKAIADIYKLFWHTTNPFNLKVTREDDSLVELSWNPPLGKEVKSFIKAYRIYIGNTHGQYYTYKEVNADETKTIIDMLQNNSTYFFIVKPFYKSDTEGGGSNEVKAIPKTHQQGLSKISANTTLNFGTLRTKGQLVKKIKITNKGTASLIINSLYIDGLNSLEFSQVNNCDIIPSKKSCSVNVTFSPISAGNKIANLSILSNDPNTPILKIKLSGALAPPVISAFTSVSFSKTKIGNTSSKILMIKNTGGDDLKINKFEITGNDSLEFNQTNNCNMIPSKKSCSVNINFSPISVGTKTANLNISTNDPQKPLFNIKLKGISINSDSANLTPYTPSGWSDKIVVSKVQSTHTDDGPYYTTDTLYVDWAVLNNGGGATWATFYTKLYVDGVEKVSIPTSISVASGGDTTASDYKIGSLSQGQHTIKIVTDATGAIAESNEADNEYTKTITINPPPTTYSISGRVTYNGSGLSGVTVSLTGAASSSRTTDSNGNYTFLGLQNGTYTITPSKEGYSFSPTSLQVTVSGANVTGKDFTATQIPPTTNVSGYWTGHMTFNWSNGTSSNSNMAYTLNQSGNTVTGTISDLQGGASISNGNVSGNTLTFDVVLNCKSGNKTLTLSHTISGSTLIATSASGVGCPQGSDVNIANYSGTLSKQTTPSTPSNIVKEIPLNHNGGGVVISPDGLFAYVGMYQSTLVVRISDNSIVKEIPMSFGDCVISANYLYACSTDGLQVIRTSDYGVEKVLKPNIVVGASIDYPQAVAISKDGNYVYTTNRWGSISVIRTSDNSLIDTRNMFPCCAYNLRNIKVSADGAYLYVIDNINRTTGDNELHVIRISDFSIVKTFSFTNETDDSPWLYDLALMPDGKNLFLAKERGPLLQIQLPDNNIVNSFDVWLEALKVKSDGKYLYAVRHCVKRLYIFSIIDNTLFPYKHIDLDANTCPIDLAISPNGNVVYVSSEAVDAVDGNGDSGLITIIGN